MTHATAIATADAAAAPFDVEVFFDGACPLCVREIDVLRRLDRHSRIRFSDIAAGDFDDGSIDVPWETLMARIHGRLPDGTVIEGVEVFRRMYAAAGFSPLVALSRLPGISHLLALGYAGFAKNRLRLTGRCEGGTCDVGSHRRQPPSAA